VTSDYQVAIIGSGPAGLSAAGRAAARDREQDRQQPSYVLLEGSEAHAKTIQRYQKGKHVMAEPGFLDLRSDFSFTAGTREAVLSTWEQELARQAVHTRYLAPVRAIKGTKGDFRIELNDGGSVTAEHVVLAIGLEGNPRKLGAPGEDLPQVQYHLDDPREFSDETIIVVGAGDSAIENALALAAQNTVWVINRRDEFSRAKDGNLAGILAAISDPGTPLSCLYNAQVKAVEPDAGDGKPVTMVLETPEGERRLPCDRIIARLGGIPPRKFVESIGIEFPNQRPDAIPELSRQYETNVPGVYIIGSLAGYPLIKQAMNQGHDVIEYINGNDIPPADHPLLEYQFHGMPYERDVNELLELFQRRIPMFRQLNSLAFRELIIESNIIVSYPAGPLFEEAERKMAALQQRLASRSPPPRATRLIREGDQIYATGDFGTSFFTIADGEITLEATGPRALTTHLSRGQFFGEMSLLSGRPRLEAARAGANCVLVETPRRTMIKLMNSNEEVREGIDWIFIVRELQRHFAPYATLADLRPIADATRLRRYKAGEVLFQEGEQGDSLHVIRSGGVTLTRKRGSDPLLVAQLRAGQLVGEMALMGDPVRRETGIATVATETIEVHRREFLALVGNDPERIETLQRQVAHRITDTALMEGRPEAGSLMNFLMREGLGEATNVLVIDEALCIGCDNCEKACAETHDGISRLDRRSGSSFANVHVPVACRHCEQPHCMKDCPPNAIHRAADGQVFIDSTCIGCGNCQVNCPYDVIRMAYEAPKKPGLFQWMLFGRGTGPGEVDGYTASDAAKAQGKRAKKCDACVGLAGGPACERACPTGAAKRIGPQQFLDLVDRRYG
jgi:thioredoxin reductase/Fe-S-cluster-containing hydrogenase component 2/CRP-like cAMP-binding protein